MKTAAIALTAALLLAAAACDRKVPVVELPQQPTDSLKENLIEANRIIAQGEEVQIDAYAQRRGWEMRRLSGGGRVREVEPGHGPRIDYEDSVRLRYRLEAINGEVFYADVRDTVVAGHLQPTRGLDAALLTLRHGAKATVILPSEQAYGVVGDGDRVKSRMILVYHLDAE